MNAELKAANPQDLVDKLDAELKAIGKNPNLTTNAEWYEKQQLWRFLRVIAANAEFVQYPLTVTHTSQIRPDFKLSLPDRTIGIEASRVSSEPYERLDDLHRKHQTPPYISISHTLVRCSRMNNDALVGGTVPGGEWNPVEAVLAFWKEKAREVVSRKTTIRRQADYQDYGGNWLVLWDKLPVDGFQVHANLLQEVLNPYWSEQNVFDVIVLESEEFKDFAVFSHKGGRVFWSNKIAPPNGGPATRSDDSRVTEGPPSVS